MFSWWPKTTKKRVYLDFAAATPVAGEVKAAMARVEDMWGNGSAIHQEGVAARRLIEDCRDRLAKLLKIRPAGVVFTGSGTESNNLAIGGVLKAALERGMAYRDMKVITTALEHPSVSEVLKDAAKDGVTVLTAPVADTGEIIFSEFCALLDPSVTLVSVAYVNSEIGVIQDVNRLARAIKKYNQTHAASIVFHVDAAQAPLWLPVALDVLGADIVSFDAGKCYGPKGVGVLAFRHGVEVVPVLFGGGQESGLRPATENTVGIVGATAAVERAQATWKERQEKITALRDATITKLTTIDGVTLNGSATERVANNINISIDGIDGEFAVVSLDEAGFAVSTKSACSGAGGGGSAVVMAISGDATRAASTIRITLGEDSTATELDALVKALRTHVENTRQALGGLTTQ